MDRTAAPGAPSRHALRSRRGIAPGLVRLVLLVVAASLPLQVVGQDRSYGDDVLIRQVTFEGVEELSESELKSRIVTQRTRCRGILLQPFCWLTDWHLIVFRHYLDEDEVRRDELRLEVHYFKRGFRETRVASQILPRDDGVEVVYFIVEGPPTIVAERRVEQTDEVLRGRHISRAELPREEEWLDLYKLEDGLEYFREHLGEAGYYDAVVTDSITVVNQRAELVIGVDPGPQSTVGNIDVRGNEQVSDAVIRDGMRIKEGEVLRTHHVDASQRSLYESNLFYEARIEVPEQADSAKTVIVEVREAPPRRAEVGGGFNTIEFFQVEGIFTHFNWLGGGRRLDLRATVGNLLAEQLNGQVIFHDVVPTDVVFIHDASFLRPTWLVSAEVRQPGFAAATDRASFTAFGNRRTVPSIVVEHSYGGSATYTRRFTYRTPLSAGYRYERTSVEAGDLYFCVNHGVCAPSTIEAVRGWSALSPAIASFLTDQSDDPLAPSRGYRVRVDLEHASEFTLSDFRYNRVSASATYYLPFNARGSRVLAGRVRTGWVVPFASTAESIGVDVFDERLLHPRKRFYSGGSRSVRGYWENQLGPRVLTVSPTVLQEFGCSLDEIAAGTCDPAAAPAEAFTPRPTGGTTVLEGSIEYRFPIRGNLRGAAFVDGAIVGEGLGGLFTEGVGAITPGVGIRYESPIGPIRADLGIRPAQPELLPVVTEFVDDNGQRTLIRLDTPYHYDPIEAAGGDGFLRQILARLRLHLSIGEAL